MKVEVLAPKWRRGKTLARRVSFRPIENEDIRFAWAAYKKGALAPLSAEFAVPTMTVEEFNVAFPATITTRYHGAWTMFADTRRGNMPVGLAVGFYPHPDPAFAPFMVIADMIWFPWSSVRNRIESAVYFFHVIRSTIAMVAYANGDTNKRFFEMICQHGVMRRIGTTFNMVKGEPVAVFETKAA